MAVSTIAPIPEVGETAYGTVHTVAVEKALDSRTIQNAHLSSNGTEMAVREYFKDIPVMIQVARCESTFRHTLADGSVLRGRVDNRDTGVMQINTGYHAATAEKLGLDLTDLNDNMAYARHLYEKQGTQPWSASAPCWNNALAQR